MCHCVMWDALYCEIRLHISIFVCLFLLAESEKHVQLLIELLPEWLKVVEIKRGKFLKLDKMQQLNDIQEKLRKKYKDANLL